jgi:mannose-6-phosphate isomerase-like protein (cupin superfamily)
MKSATWKASDMLAGLPSPESGQERYSVPLAYGDTELGFYAPLGHDPQSPHDRDEFYLVVSGTGIFFHDGNRTPFEPGDALFVSAGIEHRFEDFSDDFAAWVVLVGPRKEV